MQLFFRIHTWIFLAFLLVLCADARAQPMETTVRGDSLLELPKAQSVTVIELGTAGQANQPSPAKVSVADVLDGRPGVFVRRSGGLAQFSGASLRGSAPGQVAVFLDGVPLSLGGQSAVDLSQLPLEGLAKIEVFKGLPPLHLGSETLGGAINLVTLRGKRSQAAWFDVGSGSFGLRRASAGYKASTPSAALTVGYQAADGDFPYFYNDGLRYGPNALLELRRKNDDFEQFSVDARLDNPFSSGLFFVHGNGFFRRQGIAGIGQPNAQPGQPRLHKSRAVLDGGVRLFTLDRRVTAELTTYALLERTQAQDLPVTPPLLFEQLAQQFGQKALFRLQRFSSGSPITTRFLALAEVRYEALQQRDLCPAPRLDCERVLAAQSSRLRGILAVGSELSLFDELLLFSPGLHLLLVRSAFTKQEDRKTELQPPDFAVLPSPQATIAARLRPWLLLRLGAGRFVRLPSFLELFGDGAFFRQSPGLRPESAWTGELGLEATLPGVSYLVAEVGAHAFFRHVDDLIDVVRDGPTLRARNVGQAMVGGTELFGTVRLLDFLRIEANYTYLDSRDRTFDPARAGKLLPGRPSHTVFLRTEAAHRPLRVFYELDFVSALFLDPTNLVERPARTLHAIGVSVGPLLRLRLLLRVEMRNVADTRTLAMTLPLQDKPAILPLSDFFDYPLPGRALYATLSGRM